MPDNENQPTPETISVDIVKLVDDTKVLVEENTKLKANNEDLAMQLATIEETTINPVDEFLKGNKSEVGERELSKSILEDLTGEKIEDYDSQSEVIANKFNERRL